MIKEAINRILELAEPHMISSVTGDYVDKKMVRIDKDLRASAVRMSTLSGLVDFIKGQTDFKPIPYIVQVVSPTEVRLISSLDRDREREILAEVEADIPDFPFGQFIENEKFIINVQAKFMDGEADKNVKAGTVTKYGDDGVSQKAAIKKGVTSLSEVEVPSPCKLIPYRTFIEVDQPMSEFIFRVRNDERLESVSCALFDADGGAWKIEAMENIKKYLKSQLRDVQKNIMVIS